MFLVALAWIGTLSVVVELCASARRQEDIVRENARRQENIVREDARKREDIVREDTRKREDIAREDARKREDIVREDARRKKQIVEQESVAYNSIKPLQTRAKTICRDWTKTSCDCSDDIIKFCRMYAQQRALTVYPKHSDRAHVVMNRKLQDETNEVHVYSRAFMDFFNKKDYSITYDRYPTYGDYKDFLTFQWAVYTTNNVSKEPNPYAKYENGNKDVDTHKLAFDRLRKSATSVDNKHFIKEVEMFQRDVRPHFKIIHDEIYK